MEMAESAESAGHGGAAGAAVATAAEPRGAMVQLRSRAIIAGGPVEAVEQGGSRR